MSEARKGKEQNPFQGRLEAQLKSKGASLPTPLDYGARKMLSRVKMNAQPRGALDSFSRAGAPVLSLFHLTRAVVVIHGMTRSWVGQRSVRKIVPTRLVRRLSIFRSVRRFYSPSMILLIDFSLPVVGSQSITTAP